MTALFGARLSGKDRGARLLRAALREYCGLDRVPELLREPGGKPRFAQYSDLHFNLSHSGELVLCALSRRPVGVDIERVRPRRDSLLDRGITGAERAWCLEQSDPWPRFYILWTRRESACKRTGRGLTLPVRDIPVPLPPAEELAGVRFRSYSGNGWAASLCGEGELPAEIRWLELE